MHSDLLPYANMMADDFGRAVETLKQQGYLIVKEGRYLKDGSKDVPVSEHKPTPVSTFYRWKQEQQSPSQNPNS